MNRVRVLTALAAAALVAAAALPLGANAATMTETGIWPSLIEMDISTPSASSNPFPKFNPALGTLTDYSLTVAGTGNSVNGSGVDLRFLAPGTGNTILEFVEPTFTTFSFSGPGTTSAPGDLAGITGTGNAAFSVRDFDITGSGDFTELTFTSSSVTFDFTTVPEPASLPLLGTAMAGLLGLVALARRKGSR